MRDTGCFVLGGAVTHTHSREDGSLHFVSTVQSFGKSGWSSRTLRVYTPKESPSERCHQHTTTSVHEKTRDGATFPIQDICQDHFFLQTISSRSVRYMFIYSPRAADGELQLPPTESRNVCRSMLVGNPRIRPADEICIVGRKVAEEVVKRSLWLRRSAPPWLSIGRGVRLLYLSACDSLR